MPPVTLDHVGRKKASESTTPKKETALIRVDADLARKLSIISATDGEDIASIVSPLIRAKVEQRYADSVRKLGEDVKK